MKKTIFLFSIILSVFVSCSNQMESIMKDKAYILLNSEETTVTFGLNEISRSVLPIFEEEDFSNITLKGVFGENESLLGNFKNFKEFSNFSVSLKKGTWKFILLASNNVALFLGTTDVVLGSEPVYVKFNIKQESLDLSTGSGSLKVTVTVPESVTTVKSKLLTIDMKSNAKIFGQEVQEEEFYVNKRTVVYEKRYVPAGYYILSMELYSNDNKLLSTYKEIILVVDNKLSETKRQISQISQIEEKYLIEYETYFGTFTCTVPLSYKMNDIIELPDADSFVEEGFEGWYDNAYYEGDAITELPFNGLRDVKLYAKWKNVVTVSVKQVPVVLKNSVYDSLIIRITDSEPDLSVLTNCLKSTTKKINLNLELCSNLTKIDNSLSNCPNLVKIRLPNNITSIGNKAFSGCSGLTEIKIPESVTSIEANAFSRCSSLTEVTIPDSVTSIEQYAFSGCSSLTEVTIGESVTSIKESAFGYCSSLKTVNFYAVDCLDLPKDRYAGYPFPSTVEVVNFGNKVEYIPSCLCLDMSGITEITIPESVRRIGKMAFCGCSGLTEITIGNGVSVIKECAFSCSGLTEVTIGERVKEIDPSSFDGCSSLETVNFNAVNCDDFNRDDFNYVKYPFSTKVKTVNFGNKVEKIPRYLCYGMTDLTEITIPESVTTIKESAFEGCSSLKTVNFNAVKCTLPSSLDTFPSTVETVNIGNKIKIIPSYLCYKITGLSKVTIPESVTNIGSCAFQGCSGLTEVTIPESVIDIGDYAFSGCGLTEVTIPERVQSIGTSAFNYNSLKIVNFNAVHCWTFPSSFNTFGTTATTVNFGNKVENIPSRLCFNMINLTELTIPKSS